MAGSIHRDQALQPNAGARFDELYQQYMSEPKRKRERGMGIGVVKYILPAAFAAVGAGIGAGVQDAASAGTGRTSVNTPVAGMSIGGGAGLGLGLLAVVLLNRQAKERIASNQEDEAWRYAAMLSGRAPDPQRTLV